MRYATLGTSDFQASRLLLGTFTLKDSREFNRLDAAMELGYNVIDTAACYQGGMAEAALGEWLASRKCRDKVIILSKCAHPNRFRNRVTAFDIAADLHDCLARLRTDHVDLYLLHRDDPSVPVLDILLTLNEHIRAGKIIQIGASNWTHQRIAEANACAKENGLVGFTVSSPHFSLAEQYAEPWAPGCVSLTGDAAKEAREFYIDTQMPVLAYSSLARGLFSGRITRKLFAEHPEEIDQYCRKAYCGDTNFTRLERAAQLAQERGVTISQIALAYTMNTPMNVFPITGAMTYEELADTAAATEINLTKEETAWLNLETDERKGV